MRPTLLALLILVGGCDAAATKQTTPPSAAPRVDGSAPVASAATASPRATDAGTNQPPLTVKFFPPEFSDAPITTNAESRCTPKVEDMRFKGMVIRAPERIVAAESETLVVPICGFYQLDTGSIIDAEMSIHVRRLDDPSAQPVSAAVIAEHDRDVPRPKRGPIDPALYKNRVSTSSFNLDAQRYLRSTLQPGSYEIWVTCGPHRSNAAPVRIQRP